MGKILYFVVFALAVFAGGTFRLGGWSSTNGSTEKVDPSGKTVAYSSTETFANDASPFYAIAKSEEQSIYKYISNSDYVVTAKLVKTDVIGKVHKKAELDLSDYVAAWIYTFKVEKLLFTRENPSDTTLADRQLETFKMIARNGEIREMYDDGDKFLFFLKKIPADDPEFGGLELDKNTKYYRVYSGAQGESIFPGPGDPMHGKNSVGRIDVANAHWAVLIEQIKVLCKALTSGSKETVLINLRNLADSTNDEVVRENAVYALSELQKRANSPTP
ncbi:MAG TPA: hypothetical protein PKC65_07355 [Pyrinomonadaceae bacterium]|nr:hypothetical protein [Pyrinomonadaceae bacterium]